VRTLGVAFKRCSLIFYCAFHALAGHPPNRAVIFRGVNFQTRLAYNRGMEIRTRSRNRNRIIGIILFVLAAVATVYALWPISYRTETFTVHSNLLPQNYELEVRYPRFGPSGEAVTVDAYLRPVGEPGPFPAAGEAGSVLVAEIQTAELNASPPGQISTPLQPGTPVHFSWRMEPAAAGAAKFNLFFFIAGAAEKDGVYLQQPLWARVFPYDSFAGPGGFKYPLIFFAVFGGGFGLALILRHYLH
jgi:hypothetical protein